MQIGILTFFESDNYGTVLQAYALQDYLETIGHNATLIHFKRNVSASSLHFAKISRVYTLKQRIWNRIVMQLTSKMAKKKRERFEQFRSKYLKITSICYESGEDFLKDISKYDLLISGGDQIWNPYHKVFSLTYMMDFLSDNYRCISYGSSFGVDKIEDEKILKDMSVALGKYDAISVRESSGVNIIKKMELDAQQVVDPVFLNIERWKAFVKEVPPTQKKYGIVYALVDYSDECDLKIKNYAKENKLKMVIFPENRRNCMNCYQKAFDLSPIDFLNYIAHSEIVFTNSFHGLAFAILFHKQVVLLEPVSNEAKSKQNRLVDLMNLLSIGTCTFDNINNPIDYIQVDRILSILIDESRDYLTRAIDKK